MSQCTNVHVVEHETGTVAEAESLDDLVITMCPEICEVNVILSSRKRPSKPTSFDVVISGLRFLLGPVNPYLYPPP
jgi:hypothetical protein